MARFDRFDDEQGGGDSAGTRLHHLRPAPPPVAASRQPVSARRFPARRLGRSSRRVQRGGGVRRNVPRDRPAGAAAGGRNGIPGGNRGRQTRARRTLPRWRPPSLPMPTCPWATAWLPGSWKRTWRQAPPACAASAISTMWDASDSFRSMPQAGLLRDASVREGFARLQPLGLSFDAWLYQPAASRAGGTGPGLSRRCPIILDHIGGPLGLGPYAGRRDEVFGAWSADITALSACPNVVLKLGGVGSLRSGYDWHTRTADSRRAGRGHATLLRALHREVRRRPLHVRKQLPGGPGVLLVRGHLERVQGHEPELFRNGT